MNYTYSNPILGVYYYPRADWTPQQIEHDLDVFKACGLACIWLFFDPFYDANNSAGLGDLLDHAHKISLSVVPALGQFLQLKDHPEVKIVNADGTTSDDPRYWNMGCFRHPTLLELATNRATGFFRDFGDDPALYRIDGQPLMNFVHEAYYRNSVPEFGGGHMKPNCYCDYCKAAWREYLSAHQLNPNTPPPIDDRDPVIWQQWWDCHADAIPEFLHQVIQATKTSHPVWSTHECNDFYPASWQSVYTGNDWWRMGAVLDFGHEDMYPLEFDTRYACYVYDYAKDIMRSAMGFQGLITANGQAFNSWLGYQLPENSMSEQIYSALAHGALGLVWWTELPGIAGNTDYHMKRPPEQADLDQIRYRMIRKTTQANAEYAALVKMLEGYRLSQAKIALLYSWTTMGAELEDNHTYDTLLMYQLLVQLGYPVDIVSETQVSNGVLAERGYQALFALGCAALPPSVHDALLDFAEHGGMLFADYAPPLNDAYPPLLGQWHTNHPQPRIYTLPDGVPVPVYLRAAPLHVPEDTEVLAHFEHGTPAICRIPKGKGTIILAGSYLGWDYTPYPGYYDLGKMFPFHIRQDAALRQFIGDLLIEANIYPPITSSHPDVEVAVWSKSDDSAHIVLVINHLQSTEETTVTLPVNGSNWQVWTALDKQPVPTAQTEQGLAWNVSLERLQGCAFLVQHP